VRGNRKPCYENTSLYFGYNEGADLRETRYSNGGVPDQIRIIQD